MTFVLKHCSVLRFSSSTTFLLFFNKVSVEASERWLSCPQVLTENRSHVLRYSQRTSDTHSLKQRTTIPELNDKSGMLINDALIMVKY